LKVTIVPTANLSGEIAAPPSKAQTHRTLVAGLLSEGTTTIANPLSCDDTEATANAVSALGARLSRMEHTWRILGTGRPRTPASEINCGKSGVTLRFMVPIVSLVRGRSTIVGEEALMRRPLAPLADAMRQLGVKMTVERNAVQVEGGPPKGGAVRIRGDVSSQFISGLLLAGPSLEIGLRLEIIPPLESRSYVSLTTETMQRHSIKVQANSEMSRFEIAPGQRYLPAEHVIAGDFSSAAFPVSAAAITNSKVFVHGLSRTSQEPDAVLPSILSQMGVRIRFQEDGVLVDGGELKATSIDLRECPDLGPVAAVLGCYAEGETRISGAVRLRYKETDRLAAMASELGSLGADIIERKDGWIVRGPSSLTGGEVRSHGDHRIAMALSVAALGANSEITIVDAECISKSYPNFFEDLRSLGVDVIGL